MKDQLSFKNIRSFILGNVNYYLDKIITLPDHLKEQYYYRLYTCKDTCLITGKCKECNCETIKKAFAPESCNIDLFPDFLSGTEWRLYKKDYKINNMQEIIKYIENEIK